MMDLSTIDNAVLCETFDREGYAVIRNVLSEDEVNQVRELTDAYLGDSEIAAKHVNRAGTSTVLREMARTDPFFAALRERPDLLEIVRAMLGPEIAHCGHSILKCEKGEGHNQWHIDDVLEPPRPKGTTWEAVGLPMPVLWLSMQLAISDISSLVFGPTQVVPRSHFSGCLPPQDHMEPDDSDPPHYRGQGPVPILCNAGDAYLFNHQIWHRGLLNQSDRPRYLLQQQYCKAWLNGRFRWISQSLSTES